MPIPCHFFVRPNPVIYHTVFSLNIKINRIVLFSHSQVSFQQTFEQKRSAHLAELQQKEDEMRQMFVQRVKEKEAELKEAEKEVGVLNDLLLHDN